MLIEVTITVNIRAASQSAAAAEVERRITSTTGRDVFEPEVVGMLTKEAKVKR